MPNYIDKDKLIRDLIDNRSFYPAIVKSAIENAPVEDVVPIEQGKWQFWKIPSYSVSVTHELICSICGYRVAMLKGRHYNFCPNCGAQMRGK